MSLMLGVVLDDFTQLSKSLKHSKNLYIRKNKFETERKTLKKHAELKQMNVSCKALLHFNSTS